MEKTFICECCGQHKDIKERIYFGKDFVCKKCYYFLRKNHIPTKCWYEE